MRDFLLPFIYFILGLWFTFDNGGSLSTAWAGGVFITLSVFILHEELDTRQRRKYRSRW